MLAPGRSDAWPHGRDEFASLFDGLELVPPGTTMVSDRHADQQPQPRPDPSTVGRYGAVGWKP